MMEKREKSEKFPFLCEGADFIVNFWRFPFSVSPREVHSSTTPSTSSSVVFHRISHFPWRPRRSFRFSFHWLGSLSLSFLAGWSHQRPHFQTGNHPPPDGRKWQSLPESFCLVSKFFRNCFPFFLFGVSLLLNCNVKLSLFCSFSIVSFYLPFSLK